jgi:hypothetical protein
MISDQQEVLHRFHRTLVRELRSSYTWDFNAPLTVAEIYRDLLPFPARQDILGVDTPVDYDLALLRLLAGEGDYARIESETAVHEIRAQLASPVPDTGLYRDFASAEVRLNPDRLEEAFMDHEELPAVGVEQG